MKLLVITNNPERASFRQRVSVYVDLLKSEGINVTIAKLPAKRLTRWRLFKSGAKFDAVFLHKKCLSLVDAVIFRKYCRKIIFNYDDAIMYSDKRPEQYSRSHMVPFRRTVKLADTVLVGSSNLAEYSRKLNPNVIILPIGVNNSEYTHKKNDIHDGKIRLVWIGSSSTVCYLDEIKDVLEEIGSRYKNVVLRMICDEFIDLKNMPVEKCLWKSESRAKDLSICDIGLAPLPDNCFSRGKCCFKVLEYSSSGLPVVASPVGTNASHIVDGVTGFLANGRQQWFEKLEKLIRDEELRKNMGLSGREYSKNYDIKIIGHKFAEINRLTACLNEGKVNSEFDWSCS